MMQQAIGRIKKHGKRAARAVVPSARRAQVRQLYNRITWPAYLGRRVACNCCGGHFRRFQSWTDEAGNSKPMCPRCGSLGRHRTDWLYLTRSSSLPAGLARLLHVAPEESLTRCLRRLPQIDYVSVDINAMHAMECMDITNIGYPDASFDVIICNHVLEHIQDDRRALRELFRVLRPGGWAMLQVPIDDDRARTYEDASITDPREREHAFGQFDHVRIYGRDYVDRLQQAGFTVRVDTFAKSLARSYVETYGLDDREVIYIGRREPENHERAALHALPAANSHRATTRQR